MHEKITYQDAEIPLRYRYVKTDQEAVYVPEEIYLSVFNDLSKKSGYAYFNRKKNKTELLAYDDAKYSGLKKSQRC